jgi:hypothetical protein
MGAPSGRAELFATGRVRAFLAGLGVGFGSRVGNKLAALPAAGLRVGLAVGMLGRLPTGSGEVIVTGAGGSGATVAGGVDGVFGAPVVFFGAAVVGDSVGVREVSGVGVVAGVEDSVGGGNPVEAGDSLRVGDPVGVRDPFGVGEVFGTGEVVAFGGAVMATVAVAVGFFGRYGALPATARRTDVTFDAVTGTVSCAWSCRCVDCASTAPRSHEDVPLPLAQPKLKYGAPPLAGVARRWMVASGTLPPVVQAVTVH